MKILLLSIIVTSVANAAVTMTGVNVLGFNDENGLALGGGILGIAVVDTGGDGFGAIQAGSTLDTDTFIGDGNDLIVRTVNSQVVFGTPSIQAGFSINLDTSTPAGVASQGDQFIVYWFPDLTVANNTTTAGDVYGAARTASNWFLTADGTSTSVTSVNPAGNANFIVQVPEPSSIALICLGAFGLTLRRRRVN